MRIAMLAPVWVAVPPEGDKGKDHGKKQEQPEQENEAPETDDLPPPAVVEHGSQGDDHQGQGEGGGDSGDHGSGNEGD